MSEPDAHPDTRAAAPCVRHPDRMTRLRCQRCARPSCAQCQRPAPVGFHCVDCVAHSASQAPTARSGFGVPARGRRYVVTSTLVGVCVVVYVLQQLLPEVTDLGYFSPAAGRREPWRFLTAAFLHDPRQPLHIVFNLVCLWQMGQWLEPLLGRAKFAALYALTGLGGSVAFLLMAQPPTGLFEQYPTLWTTGTIGASGAVFGLFGAALVVLRHLKQPLAPMAVLLAINAAMPLLIPEIAWQVHLGGFVAGLAVAGVMLSTTPPARRRLQWPALGALAVVLVAAAWIRYATAPVLLVGLG